jgi:hypothetical protein
LISQHFWYNSGARILCRQYSSLREGARETKDVGAPHAEILADRPNDIGV